MRVKKKKIAFDFDKSIDIVEFYFRQRMNDFVSGRIPNRIRISPLLLVRIGVTLRLSQIDIRPKSNNPDETC